MLAAEQQAAAGAPQGNQNIGSSGAAAGSNRQGSRARADPPPVSEEQANQARWIQEGQQALAQLSPAKIKALEDALKQGFRPASDASMIVGFLRSMEATIRERTDLGFVEDVEHQNVEIQNFPGHAQADRLTEMLLHKLALLNHFNRGRSSASWNWCPWHRRGLVLAPA